MAGRTVPLTAGTKDWPRLVSQALSQLRGRVEVLEAPITIALTPTTAPASPVEGTMYMDSATHKLRVYDGTTWNDCW